MSTNQYLSSEIISNISSLSLKARLLVEGLIVGMHKSPYHGFSVEFSEHRSYNPGDEIRNIDWKIWGKTDKYFVKEYEEETNLKAHIIIDQSGSMGYTSHNTSKLEYAKIKKFMKMIKFVYQDSPRGTGDAVMKCSRLIKSKD